jgi:uncharacterized protein (TIGR03437 family)
MRTLLFLLAAPLFAQLPFTQMVVFGDSLSDNGNSYYGSSLEGDPTPGPPLYATGEYTDGANSVPSTTSPLGLWIEQLAPFLNVPAPVPYVKGGLNYAVASAQTGSNPAFNPDKPTVPWSTDQVNLFLKSHASAPSNYLYIFWLGGDDIINGASATAAAANIQANINTLAAAGAKYFLWANLPPLGETPLGLNTPNSAPWNAATVAFNNGMTAAITQLTAAHPAITIAVFDVYDAYMKLTANPALYGFTNITSPAQSQSNINPNTYVYWDTVHPTTAGHAEDAAIAYATIVSTFAGAPFVTSVQNAFGNSATIAPNTWVSVKGTALANPNDSRIWLGSDFVNNQMPTALDGVSVTFNGENAYLYYISPTQLNVLTPPDLASGAVEVRVTAHGLTSGITAVEVQPLSPSFFTFDGAHVVGSHLNYTDLGPTSLYPGVTTPAQPGEEVILYANGFGATSSPVVAGSPVQSGTLATIPMVTIGGIQANVIYAGLIAPGLYQFNVDVPQSAPSGDISLMATYNGQTTQTGVVITVQ